MLNSVVEFTFHSLKAFNVV